MEYKDYYKIFGLGRDASAEDIKRTYRKLARKYHPDVSKEANAEEKFKDLQEAYEVLKDPQKRAAYDQLGSHWREGQEFRPPPGGGGFDFSRMGGMGGEQVFEGGDFSDFFSALFGRGRGGAQARRQGRGGAGREFYDFGGAQRGQDEHAKIQISLEDAYKGATKTIQLQMPEMDANGNVIPKLHTLNVNIPAGVNTGQQLRLSGQGGTGFGSGTRGDLYLEIEIAPNRLFTLQGRDIYLTVPIAPWEAALGAKITVPTLGGSVDMKIAPGSQSGQKMRLKGRGLSSKTQPGDQYVILEIMTPPANTDAQKALYQKMAQEMPFNPRKGKF